MTSQHQLSFTLGDRTPLLKDAAAREDEHNLPASAVHYPTRGTSGREDATVLFIGTATTVIEWLGFRILTDPNFLHAGDHVHLGPGVNATRRTNPAIDLHDMPPVDCILLSHYHEDHFDRLVERSLNRNFPIITTPHAKENLTATAHDSSPFQQVTGLEFWDTALLYLKEASGQQENDSQRAVRVTGTPGQHVPPGPLSQANDILKAVPPTNGWLVDLGYTSSGQGDAQGSFRVSYTIYISGDTVMCDDLKEIPKRLEGRTINLMLIHLGGTTIPGPSAPLAMVTMDAHQGIQLVQLLEPELTIPIHFDDYDVFLSPLDDFKKEVEHAGYDNRVVYLNRGEAFRFKVDKQN